MDHGVIVDLETTGLDFRQDKIIEVGLLEFAVDGSGPPVIVGTYSGLEDPGTPLLPEIAKLTGLGDRFLEGRKIDWPRVRSSLERASVVIAHNAEFDRSFLEARPELDGVRPHWACSARHINWTKHGMRTRALNWLAADHGFVNPFAHRALFDCATTFRLVAPYLNELLARSWMREFLFQAVGAAFEKKDILRKTGYRWDPAERVWWKRIFEDEVEAEREFLRKDVYGGEPRHREEEVRSSAPSLEDPTVS